MTTNPDAGSLQPRVRLRSLAPGEVLVDSNSTWDDWGVRDGQNPVDVQRFAVESEGTVVGSVSWHTVSYGPNRGSEAYNIGIGLAKEFRGRGIGSVAQRLLVEHLFATTSVRRIEASTDVENTIEQRALEKAGFSREGVLRRAQFRADGWHDLVSYSIVRDDLDASE